MAPICGHGRMKRCQTKKEGPNQGRYFYACDIQMGEPKCGKHNGHKNFYWEDDVPVAERDDVMNDPWTNRGVGDGASAPSYQPKPEVYALPPETRITKTWMKNELLTLTQAVDLIAREVHEIRTSIEPPRKKAKKAPPIPLPTDEN